jgi:hypothetical protein
MSLAMRLNASSLREGSPIAFHRVKPGRSLPAGPGRCGVNFRRENPTTTKIKTQGSETRQPRRMRHEYSE